MGNQGGGPPQPAQIPTSLGRQLRACLRCRLVKTYDQFRESGCENCPFFHMEDDHDHVVGGTTPNFTGIISVIDPTGSWAARWLRIGRFVPGCYTLGVSEALPPEMQKLRPLICIKHHSRLQSIWGFCCVLHWAEGGQRAGAREWQITEEERRSRHRYQLVSATSFEPAFAVVWSRPTISFGNRVARIALSSRWTTITSVLLIAPLLTLLGLFQSWTQPGVGLPGGSELENLLLVATPLVFLKHFPLKCRIFVKIITYRTPRQNVYELLGKRLIIFVAHSM